jgi:hypothetical protein
MHDEAGSQVNVTGPSTLALTWLSTLVSLGMDNKLPGFRHLVAACDLCAANAGTLKQ